MRITKINGLWLLATAGVLAGAIAGCGSSSSKSDGATGGAGGGSGGTGGGGGKDGGVDAAGGATGGTGGGGASGTTDGGARDTAAGGTGGATADAGSTGDATIAKLVVNLGSLAPSMAKGTATFEKVGSQVKLTVELTGVMPAGKHGIHIHANASCADSMDDAGVTAGGAAGGHWNPTNAMHGTSVDTGHLGDIGNIDAMADGKAMLNLVTDKWSLGTGATNDVLNHAIVLHAMTDDGMTQPTGNSGARVACGVIK